MVRRAKICMNRRNSVPSGARIQTRTIFSAFYELFPIEKSIIKGDRNLSQIVVALINLPLRTLALLVKQFKVLNIFGIYDQVFLKVFTTYQVPSKLLFFLKNFSPVGHFLSMCNSIEKEL